MNRALFVNNLVKVASSSVYTRSPYVTFNKKKTLKENQPVISPAVDRFEIDLQQYVQTTSDLSDIQHFKKNLIQKYNSRFLTEQSFDAVFMRICVLCRNYKIGKQYMDHLTQSGKANTATVSRFLSLCYFCCKEIEDTREVEKICMDLKSSNQFFDNATKENIILGLSITEKWKEGLHLLIEDETTHHSLAMNAIVNCLLNNDELDSAVSLLDKMIAKNRNISDFVYENWIRKSAIQPYAWDTLSDFLVRNIVFLKQPIVQQLKDMLEHRTNESFEGRYTTVNEVTGKCQSCQKMLENMDVTDEDFAALRKRLLENVLFGKDVFIGSKPEELQKFQQFIQKTAPYDIVIDGLNVAYHQAVKSRNQPGKKVEALQSVVQHFTSKNQRILVLTRKHLLSELALKNMKTGAHVFITDNLSRDDPFLLYAAVQSKHTKFVSDDLFRDHLYRLADLKLQNVFRLWQHRAQMQILNFKRNGSVEFHYPCKFRTVSQYADGVWHIPYDDGTPRFRYQSPTTWLCLQSRGSKNA